MHFHSGSYIGSKWTCCQQRTRQTLGCEPTYFLLTKSSSRYAESKRIETVNRLNRKSMLGEDQLNLGISSNHRLSDIPSLPLVSTDDTPPHLKPRSTSCYNLVDNTFPSNFSVTQDAQISALSSCCTINTVLDTRDTSCLANGNKRNYFVSMETGCNRHQVAPLPEPDVPMFDTFPRNRKSFPSHTPPSPLVTTTKRYIIQGRSPLSSSSREPSMEYDHLSPPHRRKASIEPRVSDTNPDIIHV